jgi:hypothetical protein
MIHVCLLLEAGELGRGDRHLDSVLSGDANYDTLIAIRVAFDDLRF